MNTESSEQSTELVPVEQQAADIDEVKQATKNLVDALQRLAQAKAKVAREVTEEAHGNIETLVQEAKGKAGQKLQTVAKGVEGVEDRLTRAAKAAWEVLSAKDKD
jgi:ElaB/YqjD/DUF883 family membrane-anchored ribosome-binding protein